MTHTQRLEKMLRGENIDRPLCSAWGHVMNLQDRDAAQFATATIALQDAADFDFIKIMSNPYYLIEDTGLELIAPQHPWDCITRSGVLPVRTPADWDNLRFPRVGTGSLLREQEAITRVVDHYQGDVPVIATIFTPIMWMSYLAITPSELDRSEQLYGNCTAAVQAYLMNNEKQVSPALETLNEINQEYMHALLRAGVSGFFYCTEHANSSWDSEELYAHFARRFDMAALNSVEMNCRFNILHVCGSSELRMDYVADYPVHALNWEDQSPDNPTLAQMRGETDKVLIGGLDRLHDLKGNLTVVRDRLQERLDTALRAAGPRFILSGGCDWKYEDAHRLPLIREATALPSC